MSSKTDNANADDSSSVMTRLLGYLNDRTVDKEIQAEGKKITAHIYLSRQLLWAEGRR